MGDPHSLHPKEVTLPTSQPPMGWLNAGLLLNAARDCDVVRTRAGTPHKKEGKKKENMKKKGRKRRRKMEKVWRGREV